MSDDSSLAAPKPREVRRRALADYVHGIDAMLAELEGHPGSGVEDAVVAFPPEKAVVPIAT